MSAPASPTQLPILATDNGNSTGATAITDLMPAAGYTVPLRNVVKKIADYPPTAQRQIAEFYSVMVSEGWTLERAASLVSHRGGDISKTALSQILSGKYPNPVAIAASLGQFADRHNRNRLLGGMPHAQTRLSQVIGQVCRSAAEWHKPAFIWGKTQEGKTSALRWFCAEHAGPTIYYRTPAAVPLLTALRELAGMIGQRGKTMEKVRAEINAGVTAEHVLVIDEMHQAFTTWTKGTALQFWEVLRNLYDQNRCALILCGTSELAKQMDSGPFRELLKQLGERSPFHLDTDHLTKLKWGNNKGTLADINALGALYGLPPLAPDLRALSETPEAAGIFSLLVDLILAHSFGRACDIFAYAAQKIAIGRAMDWPDVVAAIDRLGKLSR